MVLYVVYFEDDNMFDVFEEMEDATEYGEESGSDFSVLILEEDDEIELPTGHILTYEEAIQYV